jgi:hypothetical protein
VVQRSGIEAGDGGFQVNVQGQTTLQGGVIASTDKAVDEGRNSLNTQGLSLSDIDNRASYEAKAVSVSVGTSAGQNSAGIGQASDSAASTTTAGVSGLAGDHSVRTGDASQGLDRIFDRERVTQDVTAQATVMAEFGKQASKAWGEYANQRFQQALKEGDEDGLKCWGPDGGCRAAGHAMVGGVTGNLGGAVAAASSSMVAPHLQAFLQEQGLSPVAAGLVTQLSALGVGSQLGGSQAGAAALNEAGNNAVVAVPILVEGIVAAGAGAARACLSSAACLNAVKLAGAGAVAKLASMISDDELMQIPGLEQVHPLPTTVLPPRLSDVEKIYGTPPLNDQTDLRDWLAGVLDGVPADAAQQWARGLITTLPIADQQRYSDFILNAVQDNAVAGSRREREVTKDLQAQYPQGSVQNQQYLRDKDGNIVIDPNTGTARRLDHVVIVGGKVVTVVETTSMTAEKEAQIRHEIETRRAGGTFVRDRDTGKIVEVPYVSRIERRP